jgi:hypothetical protein
LWALALTASPPLAGEWRNPSLTPTSVAVLEGCYGKSACAGVVAWAVTEDPQLLSAPQPTATPALAFRVTAGAQATTLTGLGSAAPSAALSVNVLGRVGTDPFTAGAIGANTSGWTTLYSGSWTGASVVFTTSLAVNASQSAAVVVVNSSGAGRLPCANTLGTPGAQLITDGAVTMSQGGALVNPFAGAVAVPGAACGVDGLVLAYNLTAACAPAPSPPPAPVSVGLTPTTMVLTLGDLQRALADVTVLKIVINQNIALSGTQLAATVSGTRTLTIEGGNGCGLASLCSLSARGGSRIFALTPGLTLTVSKLQLRDGVAPAGQFGGCVVANCANCALQLESVVMQNCSAANAGGGALAVLGGATLVASNMQLSMNTAAVGGGLLVSGGTVSLNSSVFSRNVATGSAEDLAPAAAALSDLPGTAGGGLALYGVTGSVTGCSFSGECTVFAIVARLRVLTRVRYPFCLSQATSPRRASSCCLATRMWSRLAAAASSRPTRLSTSPAASSTTTARTMVAGPTWTWCLPPSRPPPLWEIWRRWATAARSSCPTARTPWRCWARWFRPMPPADTWAAAWRHSTPACTCSARR